MAEQTREQRIARIQRLERIRQLESEQGLEGGMSPIPATAEEAATDSPGVFMGTLGAGAKGLDTLRGSLTAPALAATLEALTGKDVYRGAEHLDAVNPSNLSTFPSSSELFERAGVPEGAKLSDFVGGFAEPGGEGPWYQPEKGGMLDFTVRGAGGFGTDIAIDPLTYLSMGGAALAKQGLKSSASRAALAGANRAGPASRLMSRAVDTVTNPLAEGVKALRSTRAGSALADMATVPSRAVGTVGKRVYGSTLLPVEHEGVKFAKEGVADTLYNAGIKSPLGLRDKAEAAKNTLMTARDNLLQRADDAGAQADMATAMADARAEITKLRRIKDSDASSLADDLESKLNEYIRTERGVPGTPDQVRETVTTDVVGMPTTHREVIPGKPGIAPQPFSASDASKLKTFLYSNLPQSTFQQNLNTPLTSRIRSKMSTGLKDETENAVGRALGADAAMDLAELNAEAGKLIATRKGQTRVQNMAERMANNTTSLTGTDTVIGGIGTLSDGGLSGGLKAMALKKTLDALRLGTMPLGYGMRKAAESRVIAPMIDTTVRRKAIEHTGRGSREERRKRGEERVESEE